MPKITQLPSGNFRTQIYDYTDQNGKRHYKSITADSKKEVKRLAAEFVLEREENRTEATNLTIGQAIDKYIQHKSNIFSPSTVAGYTSIRRSKLRKIINIQLDKITTADIQSAINEESENCSPKTVRNINALLRASILYSRPNFKYEATLPQKIKPDIEIPTDEEMKKIFELVRDTYLELPVCLAAICGMRRSEISAVRWNDVDFKKQTLTIKTARVKNKDRVFVEKTTKTTASKRVIRLFKPALDVLQKQEKSGEYIITVNPDTITTQFHRLLKKNDIKNYRFHDLRHYAVSTMLYLNMPKKYIADYVGHETEKMIDAVYGHIMVDKKDKFVDLVNAHFSSLFDPNATQNATQK